MLIRNTWYDRFAEKRGGDFEKQGDPSNGGMILKWGGGGGRGGGGGGGGGGGRYPITDYGNTYSFWFVVVSLVQAYLALSKI